jgi:hypothetical protein
VEKNDDHLIISSSTFRLSAEKSRFEMIKRVEMIIAGMRTESRHRAPPLRQPDEPDRGIALIPKP